jgi:hypothetical protein
MWSVTSNPAGRSFTTLTALVPAFERFRGFAPAVERLVGVEQTVVDAGAQMLAPQT